MSLRQEALLKTSLCWGEGSSRGGWVWDRGINRHPLALPSGLVAQDPKAVDQRLTAWTS